MRFGRREGLGREGFGAMWYGWDVWGELKANGSCFEMDLYWDFVGWRLGWDGVGGLVLVHWLGGGTRFGWNDIGYRLGEVKEVYGLEWAGIGWGEACMGVDVGSGALEMGQGLLDFWREAVEKVSMI